MCEVMTEETLPADSVPTVVPEVVADAPRVKRKYVFKKKDRVASPKKVQAVVKKLVADSVGAIVEDKRAELSPTATKQFERMSRETRRRVVSLLGTDIEAARTLFADEMLATARQIVQRIAREADQLPHSTLGFVMSCLIDKSEALRAKQASTAGGARVNVQINAYGDGAIDRLELMKELHPEIAQAVKVQAEPKG